MLALADLVTYSTAQISCSHAQKPVLHLVKAVAQHALFMNGCARTTVTTPAILTANQVMRICPHCDDVVMVERPRCHLMWLPSYVRMKWAGAYMGADVGSGPELHAASNSQDGGDCRRNDALATHDPPAA